MYNRLFICKPIILFSHNFACASLWAVVVPSFIPQFRFHCIVVYCCAVLADLVVRKPNCSLLIVHCSLICPTIPRCCIVVYYCAVLADLVVRKPNCSLLIVHCSLIYPTIPRCCIVVYYCAVLADWVVRKPNCSLLIVYCSLICPTISLALHCGLFLCRPCGLGRA